jgi:hypothetical protein
MSYTYKCIVMHEEKGLLVYNGPNGEHLVGLSNILNYFGNKNWRLISVFDLSVQGTSQSLNAVFDTSGIDENSN